MTRKEELKKLHEFVERNGVTKLPADTRTEEDFKRLPAKKIRKKRTLRSVKRK
jgi:hypothetical protein